MEERLVTESTPSEHRPRIQTMCEEDVDQILALERSSFLTPWSKQSFLNALRNPNGMNMVSRIKEESIGYITSFKVSDDVYITNLLIDEDHRRKGYATELLRVFLNTVQEKNGCHIFLEVREGNTAAISFYKKWGFRLVGVRKRYYSDTREDALVMKISLKK